MHLEIITAVGSAPEIVLEGFDRTLFEQLRPRGMRFNVERFDGSRVGDEVHLRLGLPGLMMRWVSEITEEIHEADELGFVDEGRILPPFLSYWRHRHIIRRQAYGADIVDSIEYRAPLPGLALLLWPGMRFQFGGRKKTYQNVFGQPGEPASQPQTV